MFVILVEVMNLLYLFGKKNFESIAESIQINYQRKQIQLGNECLFFLGSWGMNRRDLFVTRSDSFPMNQEKKTLIPYIYNVSIKDPFLNSLRKDINSNFSYLQTRLSLFDVNHCMCDLANWQTTLWLCSSGIESKIFAWFNLGLTHVSVLVPGSMKEI